MDRTLTIEIPEKVYEPLLQVAHRVGRTPQELVLEWLIREVQAALEDPVEKFIGHSGAVCPTGPTSMMTTGV